jgi:iron complex outermembrane receptor protein
MTTNDTARRAALAGIASALACNGAIADTSAPGATSQQGAELVEIVITATRRSEALLEVPLSVTALTQESLDRQAIRNVSDLARTTPGLVFTPDGQGRTNISIRGITSTVGAATTGLYIDDTPIQIRAVGAGAVSANAYPAIFDLDHVEVLRGPQGTLFGAGSEGGTIRFISPEPSLTKYSAYGRSELAFTEHGDPSYELGLAGGGPIVGDSVGFRLSAFVREDGGWIDREPYPTGVVAARNTNSMSTQVFRAALAFAPTSDLTITPSLMYQYRRLADTYGYWPALSDPAQGTFRNGYSLAQPVSDHFTLPSVKIQWNLPGMSLFSNTSYFDRASPSAQDYSYLVTELLTGGYAVIPGLPNTSAQTSFLNAQKIFTQEVRLQSPGRGERLKWVVGAFFQDTKQEELEFVAAPTFPVFLAGLTGGATVPQVFGSDMLPGSIVYQGIDHAHDQQLAAFGQLDYLVTDAMTLTAGLRVGKSKFDFTNAQDGPFNGGPTSGAGNQSETPVTPKLGLTYKPAADVMVYASASKGFRPGGANPPVSATQCAEDLNALGLTSAPLSYNSDTVWSYEAGSKGRFLDRRLELEASAFYVDWKNIQSNVALTNCGFHFIGNMGSAVSRGADLQASLRVTTALTLSGLVAYTDAYYKQTVLGSPLPAGGRAVIVAEGENLPVPPLQASLLGDYTFGPFANGGQAYVHFDYQYTRGFDISRSGVFGYDPLNSHTGASHFATARVGAKYKGWDVALFAKNLFNSYDVLSTTHETLAATAALSQVTFQPRTLGVTAAYRY